MKTFLALPVVLFVLFYSGAASAQGLQAAVETNDLSVTANVRGWSPPSAARITVTFEKSGATASEASAAIDVQEKAVRDAITALSPKAVFVSRGQNIESAAEKATTISTGTAVRIERHLGVEVTELEKVPKIIDTALQKGANNISEVAYVPQTDSAHDLEAIEAATEKARAKARAVARSLGVTLGPVLSVMVTEEPVALVMQQSALRGVDSSRFSDRAAEYYVNVRFAIVKE